MPERIAQQRTDRWKRTGAIVVLLLAGGAVVNVAVAWGIAAFATIPRTYGLEMPTERQEVLWRAHRPSPLNGTARMAVHSRTSLIDTHFMMGNASRTFSVEFDERDMVRSFGWEGRVGEFDPQPHEWTVLVQSGWPMRSLSGSRWSQQWSGTLVSVQAALIQPRDDTSDPLVNALLIPPANGSEHRLIPFGVLLPGFIINTLFYALLLWLLLFAPFAARRVLRRKRRLCTKCAYPIGVSPVCTECGAAVREDQPHGD